MDFMLTLGLFLASIMSAMGGQMILDLAKSSSQNDNACCKPEATKLTC